MPGCVLLPYDTAAGLCAACGAPLTGRQRRWCSVDCELMYQRNHYWNRARAAALERDGHCCLKCGWESPLCTVLVTGQGILWSRPSLAGWASEDNWLEVNHITPRLGQGYGTGCWHHLADLESLCHRCHVKVTRRQRIDRARGLRRAS